MRCALCCTRGKQCIHASPWPDVISSNVRKCGSNTPASPLRRPASGFCKSQAAVVVACCSNCLGSWPHKLSRPPTPRGSFLPATQRAFLKVSRATSPPPGADLTFRTSAICLGSQLNMERYMTASVALWTSVDSTYMSFWSSLKLTGLFLTCLCPASSAFKQHCHSPVHWQATRTPADFCCIGCRSTGSLADLPAYMPPVYIVGTNFLSGDILASTESSSSQTSAP